LPLIPRLLTRRRLFTREFESSRTFFWGPGATIGVTLGQPGLSLEPEKTPALASTRLTLCPSRLTAKPHGLSPAGLSANPPIGGFVVFILAPRTSLDKFRQAVPEVWFRIIHVAADHVKDSAELREQAVEVALGPEGAFENGNSGRLTRRVPASRVVSAVPPPRGAPKPPRVPTPPRMPRTPPVVETLHRALEWRRQLDAGEVASQAEIARREGVTRARVTQVMMLLRLEPKVQERVLALPPTAARPTVSERLLRPIAQIEKPAGQVAAFRMVLARAKG